MKVLVADDKEDARYLVVTILKSSGYDVTTAVNGKEALNVLRSEEINLIVSDVFMPVMDGFEFCRECQADERLKKIPFVYCTATYLDDKDEEFALKLGAVKFIKKPFEPAEFVNIIKGVVENAKSGAAAEPKPAVAEAEILKLYTERLTNKLEQKIAELESENARRLLVERELRASEENFRNSMEASPLGKCVMNTDSKVLYANKAWLDIFGYDSLQELEAIPREKRYTPDSYNEVLKRVEQRKRGEPAEPRYEVSIIHKDGQIRYLELYQREVLWDGKKQYQLISQDITERKKADEDLKSSYHKLNNVLHETISVLAYTTEVRDPYTSGHQKHVAQLARAIAVEMKLPADRIEAVYLASLVHDIGKIQVPAEILNKSGKLNSLEFELIKTHPKVGYDILKPIEFPWPIADIIHQHHERINGSGYPGGLHGDRIMIEAKIMAVADVVEAMSAHRPYRSAIEMVKCLAEINNQKGILFDPEAVTICTDLFVDKAFKYETV